MVGEEMSVFTQLFPGMPLWLIVIVLVWSLVWKGLALWKAGRKNQPVWFIVMLLLNTVGLLEILYIFVFSRLPLSQTPRPRASVKKKRRTKKKAFLD